MKTGRLWLFLIAFLLTQTLSSQTGYKPGYIITLSNDTINGEIFFFSSQKNHKICQFRVSENEKKVEYSPEEIKGYRFDEGKYYISKKVPVNKDTLMLFIEFILKGKASFYYVTLNNVNHYYIETPEVFTELSEPEVTVAIGEKILIKQPKYYGKLHYALSDCPEIISEIDKTKLNHTSLINLGKDYHRLTCSTGDCIVFQREIKPSSFTIGPFFGYSYSVVNFGSRIWDQGVSGIFAGATMNFTNILSNDERLTFSVKCYFQYNKTLNISLVSKDDYGTYVVYNGEDYFINHVYEDHLYYYPIRTKCLSVNAKLYTLKTPLILNYSFGSGKWHYSIGAGVVCSFTISQNKDFIFDQFKEVYGKTIPNFLFGGILSTSVDFKINDNHVLTAGLSYDSMINTGDVDESTRLHIKTFSFHTGIRF